MVSNSKNKKSVLKLCFAITPVWTLLYAFLSIIEGINSTALVALATAGFVDSALEILQHNGAREKIYIPFIFLLIVIGIENTLTSFTSLIKIRISLDSEKKVKPRFLKKKASLDYKHVENRESWEVISRVTSNPVESLLNGLSGIMTILVIIIYMISILGIIVARVWWAAILIFVCSAPMLYLSMHAGKRTYQATRDAEKFHRRTEYLADVLTSRENVEERTLFGYGEEIGKQWRGHYEEGRKLQLKVRAKQLALTKGSSLSLNFIVAMIALVLIHPVVTGQLSAGLYIGMVGAVIGVSHQMGWNMAPAIEMITISKEYMKDLQRFLSLEETPGALNPPEETPTKFESLEFKNVRFKYPNSDKYILNGLSFVIQKGKHYAFVGRNGVGKTTITKLLMGLYSDYEGEIFMNGRELREYGAESLKAVFSVVHQDFAKYYISLKDNISLGNISGKNSDKHIEDLIEIMGLRDRVEELEEGIHTPLGKISEGGQDISQGQWQRIAIARSLNSNADVRILDEPTAALDPISESQIYTDFGEMMKGKTTILISHRLGSTKLADNILVFDQGKIVEEGTHSELMSLNGQYAEMFQTQRRWHYE